MARASVLVVDDDYKIRDLVHTYLEHNGYSVFDVSSGQEALKSTISLNPDLIVLDLMLPDISGEEVARSLRKISDVLIIMLTAKASENDRVSGFEMGADDYLVKPFSPRELVARVDAMLRRSKKQVSKSISFNRGNLVIDFERREVKVANKIIPLTRSEFDLLAVLSSRAGRVWSRYELLTRIQGNDYRGYERTIDVHVKNLRHKLEEDPNHPNFIRTVTGVGYQLGVSLDDQIS